MSRAAYLVVDSGGFLRNAPLRELADHVITLTEVVAEIRDKATRQRLQVLPYELEFRNPSPLALRTVIDFSKKTGDYASLSATDLRVLAVAYDIDVERHGGSSDHLNAEPVTKRTVEFYKPGDGSMAGSAADGKIAGFFSGGVGGGDGDVEDKNGGSSASTGFDSFQFWREPIPVLDIDLDTASLLAESTTSPTAGGGGLLSRVDLQVVEDYLRERSFLCDYELSAADFGLAQRLHHHHHHHKQLAEEQFCHTARWLKQVQSHNRTGSSTSNDVDVDKMLAKMRLGASFTPADVVVTSQSTAPLVYPLLSSAAASSDSPAGGSSADEGIVDDGGPLMTNSDSDKENEEEWGDDENEGGSEGDEEEEDDEGWITPGNLKEKKKAMNGGLDTQTKVEVACMTTDFAMQNVLKQIGLNIIGTNGLLIKETKTWILRCYACYTTTPHMDKVFCPRCGNKTLKRVSVTLNADGSQQIHISTRRQLTRRGKKFSLPAPQGGKHGNNPRLVADQQEAQQRISRKAMARTNPLDPDYIAGNSPFSVKDVTSKSAMLGLKNSQGKGQAQTSGLYWTNKNPNSAGKKTGNRK